MRASLYSVCRSPEERRLAVSIAMRKWRWLYLPLMLCIVVLSYIAATLVIDFPTGGPVIRGLEWTRSPFSFFITAVIVLAAYALLVGATLVIVYVYGLRLTVLRLGILPVCKQCRYPLEETAKGVIRCPECGTLNDASKWLINREKESGEGQKSA